MIGVIRTQPVIEGNRVDPDETFIHFNFQVCLDSETIPVLISLLRAPSYDLILILYSYSLL